MRFIVGITVFFFFFSCNSPLEEAATNKLGLKTLPLKTKHSGEPNLFRTSSGQIYLSWIESINDSTDVLQYSTLNDQSWTIPLEIARGNNWFVNWADFPQIVISEGESFVAAHWLQKSDLGTYDYDVRVSISEDKGQNWTKPFILHKDNIAAEHGFVSMIPHKEGKVFATWLDGRNTKNKDDEGVRGAMTLRAAEFNAKGQVFEAV